MEIQEFENKVKRLIGKRKRGFKIEVSFTMDKRGKYIANLELKDWKYEGVFFFGHNYNFENGLFGTFGYNNETFESENLESLVDLMYNEIKYILEVYNSLQNKEIDLKFEFEC